MKTQEEIKSRLDALQEELANLIDWQNAAYKKYLKDVDFWGKEQADDGEWRHASDCLNEVKKSIDISFNYVMLSKIKK